MAFSLNDRENEDRLLSESDAEENHTPGPSNRENESLSKILVEMKDFMWGMSKSMENMGSAWLMLAENKKDQQPVQEPPAKKMKPDTEQTPMETNDEGDVDELLDDAEPSEQEEGEVTNENPE